MHLSLFKTTLVLIVLISLVRGAAYDCTTLLMGQFLCPDPAKSHIDPKTQQYKGCEPNGLAKGSIII